MPPFQQISANYLEKAIKRNKPSPSVYTRPGKPPEKALTNRALAENVEIELKSPVNYYAPHADSGTRCIIAQSTIGIVAGADVPTV